MPRIVNLGVLVSGSGSNLQSIIDNIEKGTLPARIAIVVSNNPGAFALERARKHGIAAAVIEHAGFADREAYDRRVVETLQAHGVELVVLAGFMRVLSPLFLRAFPMRVMNIHPALLPSFPGTHGQKKALDYGVKFSGCTVHFADEGVDTGPVIIQAVVPVYDADTEDTLSRRILKEEHRIYPQAIRLYAEGKLRVEGRKVRILDHPEPEDSPRHNPPVTDF
ncbi:MAG: phosphoribosylglycinamide formyltransferase [Syntrophaceae bacterium]|nr:phosphoribosylglycinamide formyltransferase [Syntrophaceae bacterium]